MYEIITIGHLSERSCDWTVVFNPKKYVNNYVHKQYMNTINTNLTVYVQRGNLNSTRAYKNIATLVRYTHETTYYFYVNNTYTYIPFQGTCCYKKQ
jgi:hypothetical protein